MARYRSIVICLGIFGAAVYSLPHAEIETDRNSDGDFHRTMKRRSPRDADDSAARFANGSCRNDETNAAAPNRTREYTLWRQYRAHLTPERSMAMGISLVRELRRYGDEERSRILRFPADTRGFPHEFNDSAIDARNRMDAWRMRQREINHHHRRFLKFVLHYLWTIAGVRRVRETDENRMLEKYGRLSWRMPDAAQIAEIERVQRHDINARFVEFLTTLTVHCPEGTDENRARLEVIHRCLRSFVEALRMDFPEVAEKPSVAIINRHARTYVELFESLRLESPARAAEEYTRSRDIDRRFYDLLDKLMLEFPETEEERDARRAEIARLFAEFLNALMPEIP